ncbi:MULTISPECIES: urease accessory protein UreH [Paraliobacillus]|uniref:urease accessory protein UreH n=1 Tax=Paraliobacillus TaxID=200903 RepID=UPI000DD3580C|nr:MULTISPECIES: urease accessory protein UreH [Paraliobacillus]
MELGIFSVMSLGFILGIKHAIEPDHVIAVSTIASRSKKVLRSSLAGVFWGIGHTATLFIVGLIFILMKGEISTPWMMSLELLVGLMLVYLGFTTVISYRYHSHHVQKSDKNSFRKSMLIGLVHGLAGSGAMILLTMSTVDNVWLASGYIIIFGVGTVIGMLLFTTLIGIPFVVSKNKQYLNKVLTQLTGGISVLFGIYYIYNLGVKDGLFTIWMQAL